MQFGDGHGEVALRAFIAVPADVVGRAGGGFQIIGLVRAGILSLDDGFQGREGHFFAVDGVDAQHGVVAGDSVRTFVADAEQAVFGRSEGVPNGGLVGFVFAFFHSGAGVVTNGGAFADIDGISQVVVGRRSHGTPTDVVVDGRSSGQDKAVERFEARIIFAFFVRHAAFFDHVSVFVEVAVVRAVVVDGIVDEDFFIDFHGERHISVGQ